MPLSDDELDGYERWFKYVQDNMPFTYATEGIPMKGDAALALIAELRAARKHVAALEWYFLRGEGVQAPSREVLFDLYDDWNTAINTPEP